MIPQFFIEKLTLHRINIDVGGISCVLCQRNIIDGHDLQQVVTNGNFLVKDDFDRLHLLLWSRSFYNAIISLPCHIKN